MEYINNYGCLRKVDTSTNQAVDFLSFAQILFNQSIRKQLYDELKSSKEIKLFCSCCNKNQIEIRLTDTYGLTFSNNSYHTRDCLNYIRLLGQYIYLPSMAPFTVQTNSISVSFRWQKGVKTFAAFILGNNIFPVGATLSLNELVAIINIRSFEEQRRFNASHENKPLTTAEHISDMVFEFGKYMLNLPDNTTLRLSQVMFMPQQALDTISFLYARVLEINSAYKTTIYLLCEHNTGNINICIDRTKWDTYVADYIIPDLPLYLCGFVTTHEVSAFKPGFYDSKTHKYRRSESTKKKQHKLKTFVAFHTNKYGLICFSKEEYDYGNILSANGTHYWKPYYPVPGLPHIPLLQIHSNDTATITNYPEVQDEKSN